MSMSYNIETRSITEFVTDSKIKLPRFQRKSTWTAKQNFELAISIFQEYPVGVVIINDEGHTSWLLDGRQRRSALKDLRANPDLVYDWARKYIKFKASQDVVEVKEMFWEKLMLIFSKKIMMMMFRRRLTETLSQSRRSLQRTKKRI